MANPVQNVEEEWRVIKDYPNYEVSNLGRVRMNGKTIYKGSKERAGYVRISLKKDNKQRKFFMHRLVAEAFIPNPENKPQVNHLGAKYDNRVNMLEWVTAKENSLHGAKKNRRNKINQVISVAKVNKYTDEIIKIYTSIIDIENDGYNYEYILTCCRGVNKTHLGYKWMKQQVNSNEKNKNLEGEIWKSLKDSIYEEVNKFTRYEVSNLGRVKGVNGNILSPGMTTGIATVHLLADKIKKEFSVYRLVIMGFNIVKPHANMNEVDHINSINTDNRLSNLCWANRYTQVNNENTRLKKIMKIKFTKDGVETLYTKGIGLLAQEINITREVIYKYIVLKKEYKGYKFELLDEEEYNINTRKRNELLNIQEKNIKVKKVFKVKVIYNNEEKIFNSIKYTSLYTNISHYHIKKYSKSGECIKGYRFKILNDEKVI